jgi:hypothetical protein
MAGTVSAAEVGRRLWRNVPETEVYLVLSEVLGHLDLLEQGGRVYGLLDGGLVRWDRTENRARSPHRTGQSDE